MEYIGTDTADTTFYVQEVCNEISQLHQVWKDGKGRVFMDTPEDLYQKYLNQLVSLPDNATNWDLQLPHIYLSTLDDKFCCYVTSADDFHMPYLIVPHTKSKQLQGLQEVWNESVKFFTQMEEDIEHWR